jgi:hypothetical protein
LALDVVHSQLDRSRGGLGRLLADEMKPERAHLDAQAGFDQPCPRVLLQDQRRGGAGPMGQALLDAL